MNGQRKRRRILLNGALVTALAAIGVFGFRTIARGNGGDAGGNLRTAAVARGTVVETVSASGTVSSARTMNLNFATGGQVTKIDVVAGDQVKEGQVLAKAAITPSERQQLVSATASLASARASLDDLEEGTSASDAELAQAKATVATARLAVYQARALVDGAVLKAPIAGTVMSVNGSVADTVAAGTSATVSASSSTDSASSTTGFIVLSDLDHPVVRAYFSETDTAMIGVDDQATVTLDALPDAQVTGTVEAIDTGSTVVNNVVDYGVTVALSDLPEGIRPGQTANIQVIVARADDALYVPSAAVQTSGGSSSVIVLTGGRQVTTTVTVGVQGDQTTQIVSGLSEGQRVVIASSTSSGGFPGGGFPGGGRVGGPGAP
jgi:macrolide-specific efflux system membrane fusion protein